MGARADRFKIKVERDGQAVTLYSFSAYASGDYVDPKWNAPDPDDPDYPASGTAPGPTYGAAQAITAMVQPVGEGEKLVRTPWGEEVKAALKAYFAYDVTVAHRDRVTYDNTNYWVVGLSEWYVGSELIFRKAMLVEEIV